MAKCFLRCLNLLFLTLKISFTQIQIGSQSDQIKSKYFIYNNYKNEIFKVLSKEKYL